MAKVSKEVNRALVVLIGGIVLTTWVMVNAGELIASALIFLVFGVLTIFLMLNWKNFRPFGS